MRRLLIILVAIGALVLAGILAGVVIAKPLLEERIADQISQQVGAPVEVSMDLDRVPGGLAGRVGDVHITADQLERDGLVLQDLQVTIDEADVAMLDLARGKAQVGWDELRMSVGISEEELQRYIASRLAAEGVPGAQALQIRVVPQPEGIYVRVPGVSPVRVLARVVGEDKIALEVQGSGAAARVLRAALPDTIDVGPLPLHMKLTGIRYGQGVVYVEGRRGPGSDTFD
jgi:hypothetical protein